jgi:hypothetical protein
VRRFSPLAALLLSCAAPDFDAPSHVDSMRVLAARADQPYAPPGASVNLEALAVDGRASPSEPMHVFFLPTPCFNPPGDAYYGCFPAFAKQFPRDVDLGAVLGAGTTFQLNLPSNIIDTHGEASALGAYGVAYAFFIACAGHVEYRPEQAGAAADAVPFGCFDVSGHRLGAEDFVFAYATVYAFGDRSNQNRAFDSVSYDGHVIDPSAGLDLAHCTQSRIDDCPTKDFDLAVPSSSQELDPSNLSPDGAMLRENLYVQYFSTGGKLTNDTTILFDARNGRLAHTGDSFKTPLAPGEYQFWAVLHDNRSGVSWQSFALHVQ